MKSLIFGLLLTLISATSYGQVTYSTGMGSIEYSGFFGSSDRRAANRKALETALDNHIANSNSSTLARLYEENRPEIMSSLDRFVVGSVVLNEERDRRARTYAVVVRAEINDTLLQNYITENFETNNIDSLNRSLISFIFMARMSESVQTFQDREYQRSDDTINSNSRSEERVDTTENESIRGGNISLSGVSVQQSASTSTQSRVVETGGSTTRRADLTQMRVTSSQEVNIEISGILSSSGYEVVDAEFVEAASDGKLDIEQIRQEFGSGTDISAQTLSSAAEGMRMAEIPYFALGTLDIGIRDIDPVTGNARVYVTVTGKIYDVRGRFPRTVVSVGPVQYSGLGPDESVARTNALSLAAERTATEMANSLGLRSVR